jgi:hypothetical protein
MDENTPADDAAKAAETETTAAPAAADEAAKPTEEVKAA